jgi:hypothetical protein
MSWDKGGSMFRSKSMPAPRSASVMESCGIKTEEGPLWVTGSRVEWTGHWAERGPGYGESAWYCFVYDCRHPSYPNGKLLTSGRRLVEWCEEKKPCLGDRGNSFFFSIQRLARPPN